MSESKTYPVDIEVPRNVVPIMSMFPKGFPFELAIEMIAEQNMSSQRHGFPPPFKIVDGGCAVSIPYMNEMIRRSQAG